MQGNNGQQGNQSAGQGQKPGGLSWSQSTPPRANTPVQPIVTPTTSGGAKPISQISVPPMANKNSNMQNGNKNKNVNSDAKGAGAGRAIVIFVVGVIVGLLIGWGWSVLRTDTDENTQGTATTTATVPTTPSTGTTVNTNPSTTGTGVAPTTPAPSTGAQGSFSVSSTQSAGFSVAVSGISVSKPTWVVIFENSNGKPGNALGAHLFFPGDKAGSVELLRGTTVGQQYFAGEYADDGDRVFSLQSDARSTEANSGLVQFSVR